MEAPQYNNLLANSNGYITQSLRAYEANPVWQGNPKIAMFKECAARARSIAYQGKLGYSAAACLAEFIVNDMFAEVVSGQLSAKDAMAKAQTRAERYYRV